jgi:hypothetical protein
MPRMGAPTTKLKNMGAGRSVLLPLLTVWQATVGNMCRLVVHALYRTWL